MINDIVIVVLLVPVHSFIVSWFVFISVRPPVPVPVPVPVVVVFVYHSCFCSVRHCSCSCLYFCSCSSSFLLLVLLLVLLVVLVPWPHHYEFRNHSEEVWWYEHWKLVCGQFGYVTLHYKCFHHGVLARNDVSFDKFPGFDPNENILEATPL